MAGATPQPQYPESPSPSDNTPSPSLHTPSNHSDPNRFQRRDFGRTAQDEMANCSRESAAICALCAQLVELRCLGRLQARCSGKVTTYGMPPRISVVVEYRRFAIYSIGAENPQGAAVAFLLADGLLCGLHPARNSPLEPSFSITMK